MSRPLSRNALALYRAKNLLREPSKWCKGAFFRGDAMCLAWAVFTAAEYNRAPIYALRKRRHSR